MPPQPWKTLSTRDIYRNKWMALHEDIAEMPNGRTTLYGVCEFGQCVGVLHGGDRVGNAPPVEQFAQHQGAGLTVGSLLSSREGGPEAVGVERGDRFVQLFEVAPGPGSAQGGFQLRQSCGRRGSFGRSRYA